MVKNSFTWKRLSRRFFPDKIRSFGRFGGSDCTVFWIGARTVSGRTVLGETTSGRNNPFISGVETLLTSGLGKLLTSALEKLLMSGVEKLFDGVFVGLRKTLSLLLIFKDLSLRKELLMTAINNKIVIIFLI